MSFLPLHLDELNGKTSKDLPLRIGEHEFAEFEIPENDALFMALLDGFGDLPEEAFRFDFPKPFPHPHVGVEVAEGLGEHEVHELFTENNFVKGVDSGVAVEAKVS